MHSNYAILSFGSEPTLHLQAHDEKSVLCGNDHPIAIPHLPIEDVLEYAPHELGILLVAGAIDYRHMCPSCSDIMDGILDLEDDLIEMEYGQTA